MKTLNIVFLPKKLTIMISLQLPKYLISLYVHCTVKFLPGNLVGEVDNLLLHRVQPQHLHRGREVLEYERF